MAEEGIFIMSHRELKRLHVVRKVLDKVIKQRDAGELLSLSIRQVRRIVRRVRDKGDGAVVHGSRGKPSNRAYPGEMKDKVRKIYRDKYWDFGPLLASEKLLEVDKIRISDETLRKWLMESGDWEKRRKMKKHRKWRERKHYCGEMLQGDGSHHDWFEERGQGCVLMGFIDDATGRVYARFYEYEGKIPAMDLMKRYSRKYGLPISLYMDNHTTYKSNAKPTIEDELAGRRSLSQFERGVEELGIKFIHARSPQAKGRIERLFKTFQDRVVKEMRLAGVSTIREGNEFLRGYLPKYNKRFSVMPKEREDMHREIPEGVDLDDYLCIKTERVLRNDFTVANEKRLYQVISRTRAKKVVVEERISGKVVIRDNGRILDHSEIMSRPEKQASNKPRRTKRVKRPEADHPWRKKAISYPQNYTYPQKEKSSKKEKGLLLLVH